MLFIAIPCLNNVIHSQVCKSLIELKSHMDFHIETISFDSLIPRARDYLVHLFLQKKECDKILFIDSDIVFSASDVIKLYNDSNEIVCGGYPKKKLDPALIRSRVLENSDDPNEILKQVSRLAINVNLNSRFNPESNYLELTDAPTGFLMCHRNVFDTLMKNDAVEYYYSDIQAYSTATKIGNFFNISVENGRLLSEDYWFSRLCQNNGFVILMHLKIYLKHIGNYIYS